MLLNAPDLASGEDGSLIAIRPLYGGKVFSEVAFSNAMPQMATVRSNTFLVTGNPGKSAQVIPVTPQVDPSSLKKKVLGVEKAAGAKLDITEAEMVVAAGRGIKGAENFKIMEDLADVLKCLRGNDPGCGG